jgi:putative transcription factor
MECEICGKEIEEPIRVEIDRVEFNVCPTCAKLGREIKDEPKVIVHKAEEPNPPESGPLPSTPKPFEPPRVRQTVSGVEEVVLAPDFGRIIQRARTKKGLTLQELAEKIFEKESNIRRIESQKATPRDELVAKLEKFLEVKLHKKVENDDV